MIKINRIIPLILLILAITSCSDEYVEGALTPTTTPRYLNASKSKLSFNANGGMETFDIQSVSTPWSLSTNADWVSLSPTSGSESSTITVNVRKNDAYSEMSRTCDIVLTSSGEGVQITRHIGVTQEAPSLLFTVDPEKITLKGGKDNAFITVESNSAWTYACAEDWLTMEKSAKGLTITSKENNTGSSRTAPISFSSGKESRSVIVTQKAAGITASSKELSFTPSMSSQNITITAEASWKAKTNDQWIAISPQSGNSGSSTITITVSSNPSKETRVGYFTIENEEFKVTQEGVVLSATPSDLTFAEKGETLNLTINSNTKWQLVNSTSWITLNSTSGEGKSTVKVTAAKNTESVRSAEMTLQTTDGAFKQTIGLNQNGSGVTIIDDMQEFPAEGKTDGHSLTKNLSWTAKVVEGESWLKINSTTGSAGFVIFTVNPNTATAKRKGAVEITFSDGSCYRYIIHQAGVGINLSTNQVQFLAKGGTSTDITSNTSNVTIKTSANWITAKMVGNILSITVSQNTDSEQRDGTVTLSCDGYEATVTVHQSGTANAAPALVAISANGTTVNMVHVNSGTFTMGATKNTSAMSNEYPAHNVTLSDYYIASTEVTQKLWKSIMGGYPSASGLTSTSLYADEVPACYVNYDDCMSFINKLKEKTGYPFRLPTEAEWEYAARGANKSTSDYLYSGSSLISYVGWYSSNASEPKPVGQKVANKIGLYDMSGNVWEWCSDWYSASYYGECNGATDPLGPTSGKYKVVRGGGWHATSTYCRVSNRDYSLVDSRTNMLGMRLAMGGPTIRKEYKLSHAKEYNQSVSVNITQSELTKVLGLTKAQIDNAFATGKASIVTSYPDYKAGKNTAQGKYGGWFDASDQPGTFSDTSTVYIDVFDDIYNWTCGLNTTGCKVGEEHMVNLQYQVCVDGQWHYAIVKINFIIGE